MIPWVIAAAILVSFAISFLSVPLAGRVATMVNMLDFPQRHKVHAHPVPLLGGCAIFAGILVPSLMMLSLASFWTACGIPSFISEISPAMDSYIRGAAMKAPLALGILAGAAVLHIVGLIDDRKNLGPYLKLVAQFAVCGAVVVFGKVQILTVLGEPWTSILSVIWLVTITNSFNFLDNMDGLAGGVAVICAAALLGAAAGMGQVFVAGWLCMIIGAVGGFLPYNFPPAKIFMGDAGSLVIGFLLGVASCLTTYLPPGGQINLYGVLVPVVLMAIPLYDTMSVIVLRLRERSNPMVGDRRHFSHRLVRRGMSVRAAVLTIYSCTAATAIAASLLPHVATTVGALLVLAQTVFIVMIVALLESADRKA